MKTLGSVLFVAMFVLVSVWRVKPEWLGLGHKTPPAFRLETSKLRRLATTCDAYASAVGAHVDRLQEFGERVNAAQGDAAAQRAAMAELAAFLRADRDALARVIPPASIEEDHARWIEASDRLADAADAQLAALDARDADRVASATEALAAAAAAHDRALDAVAADCR
jgi:hypothetical protein